MLILALCLAGCRHKPDLDPNCGEANSIDKMMEWTYFKTGTYWIYQEQNTGVYDTCTVYFDYNGIHPEGWRDFVVKIRSSHDGFNYIYWFNDSWSSENTIRPGCPIRVVECDKYVIGNSLGGTRVFPFPLFVGNTCGQYGSGRYGIAEIISIADRDTLMDSVYFNVVEVRQDCGPQHGFRPSTYKLCHRVGIIQKTIPHLNEDWVLIEKHINQ
jgi:hypothetical protein